MVKIAANSVTVALQLMLIAQLTSASLSTAPLQLPKSGQWCKLQNFCHSG
ncbi:hypothetical protein SAMN04488005_2374 [Yoonia tamlensis]|uniref:Uncharacterized protein n=1 Tax=Yoonia tamlensis TaxID=390270 RepID=A0A1I6GZ49_9RHOB|nr:hypothetical protein SAMN04488005_2374 [Yoonia tamlensis]